MWRPKKKQNSINDETQINNNDHTQPDKISSLPDTLLITILSKLPTNSAATTSVLSRRWRHLWTQVTHLFFEPWINNHYNITYFMKGVNNILFHLTSSKLHTFHLSYSDVHRLSHDEIMDSLSYLNPWIHFICRRNPEVIKVDLFIHFHRYRLVDLPLCLFQTQSLVNLELISKVDFRFPVNLPAIINLPNLKKLHLFLHDSNCHVIVTFIKSCPLLEDLGLFLCLRENNHSVSILVPNLKNLVLDTIDSMSTTKDCKFVIDAPKLEGFKIDGALAMYEFVTIPSELQQVEISLYDNTFLSEEKLRAFRGISCARSIILGGDYGVDLLPILNDLPIFRNLVHLKLMCDCAVDWSRPKSRCWWDNLKKIDVKIGFEVFSNTKILCDILSCATALEQLNVSPLRELKAVNKHKQLWGEYIYCREIFECKRSSSSCHIQFSGNLMTASSIDFSNGGLTCQIKNDVTA